jgi:hypothetical protein
MKRGKEIKLSSQTPAPHRPTKGGWGRTLGLSFSPRGKPSGLTAKVECRCSPRVCATAWFLLSTPQSDALVQTVEVQVRAVLDAQQSEEAARIRRLQMPTQQISQNQVD